MVLETVYQQRAKDELVINGVLRQDFARDLGGSGGGPEDLQATLQNLLVTLGFGVPLFHTDVGERGDSPDRDTIFGRTDARDAEQTQNICMTRQGLKVSTTVGHPMASPSACWRFATGLARCRPPPDGGMARCLRTPGEAHVDC